MKLSITILILFFSSLHIKGQTLTYSDQLGTTGVFSTDNGKFDRPIAVAFSSSGSIYVVDRNNERIQYFNSSLTFQGKWGTQGTGNTQFDANSPDDIAIDGDDNVWVVDRAQHRVQKFTSTGTFLLQLGTTDVAGSTDGEFDNPAAIGYNPVNGFIYVGDRNNERIQYFNASGVFQGKWGSAGAANDQFFSNGGVEDISFDATGNVWVSDRGNHRVQKFNSTGTYQSSLGLVGSNGTANGQFDNPTGVAVNTATGQVFVGDRNNERIQVFASDGSYIEQFGSTGTGNLQFANNGGIQDLSFSADNSKLFVSDLNNSRVQILNVVSAAPSSATVAATAFLEGAWNGSSLNTTINGSIPAQQPYNGTNSHLETTNVTSMPSNAVDWVLVELREAGSAIAAVNSTKVGSAAGLLMNDGSIKATDGSSDLDISLTGNTGSDFFVVIYHRNHLPIMSAVAISESSGTYTIDFTSSSANTYQTTTALASLSGGKFGMPAGDIDQDGDIDATDLSTWRTNNGITFSYSSNGAADFNLDGVINAVDRNDFHQKNTSKTRQVPSS